MKTITTDMLKEAARVMHDALRDEGKLTGDLDQPWVLLNDHQVHFYCEIVKHALWKCAVAVGP